MNFTNQMGEGDWGEQDKHKAPAPLYVSPLSLQDGRASMAELDWERSSSVMGAINRPLRQPGCCTWP